MRPQARRVFGLLQAAGTRGVHSHELRKELVGNPSQRIAEIEDAGHRIAKRRERSPFGGKAFGTRYVLEREASRHSSAPPPVAPPAAPEPVAKPPASTTANHYDLDLFG